jgi:hypothetical protein
MDVALDGSVLDAHQPFATFDCVNLPHLLLDTQPLVACQGDAVSWFSFRVANMRQVGRAEPAGRAGNGDLRWPVHVSSGRVA